MSQEIDALINAGLIEKTKGDYIREKFQDFTQAVEEWSEKANSIVVTDDTQKELMAEAREGRLLLRAKRIEVEKVRKSLKEQSLNEGRLIDSIAKYLIALIEPAEKHLELQEKFKEIQDQNKRIQLKADRTELLQPYKDVIDPNSIQLDLITEEAFTTILNGAKFAQDNKKAEALRVEEERKETERKQKLFIERSLQIAVYKNYYNPDTDLILTTETETIEFNMFFQNLIMRHGQEVIHQDKIKKENEILKNQRDEALKLEQERLKDEKKQNLFQERRLQVVEYKQFYISETDLILTTDTSDSEFNLLMKDLAFRKSEYLQAQSKVIRENESLKKQNDKKTKEINQLKKEVEQTLIPEPTHPIAQPIPNAILTSEDNPSESDTIMVNRSEYELLKKRYVIAKTALESVLWFIVPQNLRDLVNKAIFEMSEL